MLFYHGGVQLTRSALNQLSARETADCTIPPEQQHPFRSSTDRRIDLPLFSDLQLF
jgi:hypothetical protein